MSSDNLGSNLVYFLLGAATGAAIALLYAPQEGEATRRLIGEKAGEYKDKAADASSTVASQAKEKYGTVADKVQDLVAKGQQTAQDALSKGQQAAHEAINKSADKANDAVDKVS